MKFSKYLIPLLWTMLLMVNLIACTSDLTESVATEGESTVTEQETAATAEESATDTQKPVVMRPPVTGSYPLTVTVEKQELDVLRQDADTTRRLVYLKIENTNHNTYKGLKLAYADGGKSQVREIYDVFFNERQLYDTMWIASDEKSVQAVLSNDKNQVVWRGTLEIQPAEKSFTVEKSKVYGLEELSTMSLRGINYLTRYNPRCAITDQGETIWDSEYKEIAALNANAVRTFNSDGSLKPAGETLKTAYAKLKKTNPAPWEK